MAKTDTQAPVESFGDLNSKFLALVEEPGVTDPEQISKQIVERILGAETVDDILGMADSAGLNAEAVGDRTFVITDRPTWLRSTYKGGLGVFALVPVKFTDDGSVTVLTCGGQNVMGQLYALQMKGVFGTETPFGPVQFITKGTAAGFDVLWLKAA